MFPESRARAERMKTLMLLRHAKSSWADEDLDDHDRPLDPRGEEAAPAMGRLMAEQGLVPELILSSTALRARATAELVASASGFTGEIRLSEELYLAPAGVLLDTVRLAVCGAGDDVSRLLVIAHNPGLENLVAILSGRPERFPTAALAVFDLDIDSWNDLELGVATRLRGLWRPRELP
jgi:phosphohistidine phosphatase